MGSQLTRAVSLQKGVAFINLRLMVPLEFMNLLSVFVDIIPCLQNLLFPWSCSWNISDSNQQFFNLFVVSCSCQCVRVGLFKRVRFFIEELLRAIDVKIWVVQNLNKIDKIITRVPHQEFDWPRESVDRSVEEVSLCWTLSKNKIGHGCNNWNTEHLKEQIIVLFSIVPYVSITERSRVSCASEHFILLNLVVVRISCILEALSKIRLTIRNVIGSAILWNFPETYAVQLRVVYGHMSNVEPLVPEKHVSFPLSVNTLVGNFTFCSIHVPIKWGLPKQRFSVNSIRVNSAVSHKLRWKSVVEGTLRFSESEYFFVASRFPSGKIESWLIVSSRMSRPVFERNKSVPKIISIMQIRFLG